MVFEVRIFLLT